MYAAAGGASIASRRKQKRLLLHKRGGGAGGASAGAGAGRGSASVTSDHQVERSVGGNLHHQARIRSAQFPRPSRISKPPNLPPPLINCQHQNQPHTDQQSHNQQLIPVSPITFPISPPPLSISLESSNSLTYSVCKSNHFPFPPPPDLRVSSSTELQVGNSSPICLSLYVYMIVTEHRFTSITCLLVSICSY